MDKGKKRGEILVKIVCLMISFGLWLYISNVENPIRTRKLDGVPVQIINTDNLENSKLTILPEQDFKVNLTLEGPASEVFSVKAEQFKIVADLSNYAVKKGDNLIPVQITQYPSNINIKKNESLRINIQLDELVEKSVPIKLEMDTSTKNGFYSFNPVLKPDNALVSGAAKYIDTVKWVVAKGDAKNVEQDVYSNLPLKAVDEVMKEVKYVNINPKTADVYIPVKKSKSVSVNVKTKGTPNKNMIIKSLEAVPSKVDIVGEDNVINSIKSIDTEPIDLSSIAESKELSVKLSLPNGALLVNGKDFITVKVNVEVIKQKNMTISIGVTGLAPELKAVLSQEKLSVIMQAPEDVLNSIHDEDITANLDLTKLTEGEFTLVPKVTTKKEASIISISPDKVKVIISKKE